MFLGEISFVLELALFVAGLTLWHYGRQGAAPLRAGGLIAMVGAALASLCTAYFMVRYHVQGDFDHAYPFHGMMERGGMREHGEMMGRGGMGPGMMGGMMKEGMRERMGPGAAEEKAEEPGHEEHHPEQATE